MSDEKKLQQFLGKIIGDFGAAMSVPLVRIGIRLGLYKALDGAGPMTSVEFAASANISERYGREWLAQNGFDARYGARPMARLIHEKIKQPLANEILFGKLVDGGSVTIEEKDGELVLNF